MTSFGPFKGSGVSTRYGKLESVFSERKLHVAPPRSNELFLTRFIRNRQFQLERSSTTSSTEARRGELWTTTRYSQSLQSHVESLVFINDKGYRGMHCERVIWDGRATPSFSFSLLEDLCARVSHDGLADGQYNVLRISRPQTLPRPHHKRSLPSCFSPMGLPTVYAAGTTLRADVLSMRRSLRDALNGIGGRQKRKAYLEVSIHPCFEHPRQVRR